MSLLFCFSLNLINGAFSLFLTQRGSFYLKLYRGIVSSPGGRRFSPERAFIYFSYQGTPPHLERFKLNPGWLCFMTPQCKFSLGTHEVQLVGMYSQESLFTYFPATQGQIQNRQVFLLSIFVWQGYFSFNIFFNAEIFLFSILWASFKEEP